MVFHPLDGKYDILWCTVLFHGFLQKSENVLNVLNTIILGSFIIITVLIPYILCYDCYRFSVEHCEVLRDNLPHLNLLRSHVKMN